jgi:uncharacterized protein
MTEVARVVATDAALDLIVRLRARLGAIMFHQAGGICDGSALLFFPDGYLSVGNRDRLLGMALVGEIGGCKFFIGANQFEVWKHQQFIVDVAPIRGGMFSMQGSHGLRFFTRSRILSAEELAALEPPQM